MSQPLYTWDFSYLRNVCGPPDAGVKVEGVKVKVTAHLPPTLPLWAEGLAERDITEAPDPARPPWDNKGPRTWEHVTRYTDKGRAWVMSVLAGLDKRFPHREECSEGFFVYTHPGKGLVTLYDPGYDMHREWRSIFGKTAPMFTDCRRLPAGWRPWTSSEGGSPTVFYNGLREDWHQTDSLGAPYFAGSMAQTRIDWLYTLTDLDDRQALLDKILPELGFAVDAWKCRVQP